MALRPLTGDLDQPATQPVADQPQGSGIARRALGDSAVDLGRGVIGVGEAAVGLTNIVNRGATGRVLERAGYQPEQTKDTLGELYSPERKVAQQRVAEAQGFVGRF